MYTPRPLQFSLGTAFLAMLGTSLLIYIHVAGYLDLAGKIDTIVFGPGALYLAFRLLWSETQNTLLAILLAIAAMLLLIVGSVGTLVLCVYISTLAIDLVFGGRIR